MNDKSVWKRVYELIRYGAVQKPLPDFSKVKVVRLYANGLVTQFGAYNRDTGELMIFDGFNLTDQEIAWVKQKAEQTIKWAVVFPILHDVRGQNVR